MAYSVQYSMASSAQAVVAALRRATMVMRAFVFRDLVMILFICLIISISLLIWLWMLIERKSAKRNL